MRIYILAGFLFLTGALFAQVNTEKYRTPEDLRGFAGFAEVDGTLKTGNSEKTELGIEGRVDYRSDNALTFIIFQTDYEWVNGRRSSDEGLLHGRYVRNLKENFKLEFFGQVNYDKKILVDNRELIGAGVRINAFDFEESDMWFGTAYMFEHENYDLDESARHTQEERASRWSNYVTYHLHVNELVRLASVVYYQPKFNNFDDFRLLSENSLLVDLSKLFSISINFGLRYDSDSPDEVEELDTKTKIGLAVRF